MLSVFPLHRSFNLEAFSESQRKFVYSADLAQSNAVLPFFSFVAAHKSSTG